MSTQGSNPGKGDGIATGLRRRDARDKLTDLVALIYFRASNESDVYDEVWELGLLVGHDDEDEPLGLDEMRDRLRAFLDGQP